jgi:hypothetical protein
VRAVLVLTVHLLVTLAKLLRPGGSRAVATIVALKRRNPHFGCVRIAKAKDSLWSVDHFRCESIPSTAMR